MNEDIQDRLYHEDMKLASIKKRSMAFFVDEMLLSLLLIIGLGDSFLEAKTLEEMILLTNKFFLEYMVIKIIYQAFFVMQYGATLGKLLVKIRVVEIKTLQKPNVIVALNRAIIRVISEMLFYLGFLWGVLDPSRQAWHDKSAKTLVVDV
ncbi:RDD protein [Sulfurimonas denitrificans DSM 1251]|uniref:RDD protein n=1 Tax=Sulfurimonas denitrificans (strain ATCC 33889 / DSM 1251) TaxID=326298 RepID=Q30TH5_SULDN|nr:RDD family protein [Sulfurimonas denitrificans]ABB43706.1 RDD protein [Sulfurimonas denitrificans DSM 1251]MDD3442729.1 RDD family protein [Sulfurimonas denitrificans]